jgi:hypothetical protein
MKAAMTSNKPMTMNQIPSRTASTVTDVIGSDTTTIPAMRLTIPKKIHQPRPSREPAMPPKRPDSPWTIQVRPTSRPMKATVRCRWRISTTPMTTYRSPAIPSQTRPCSALSNTRIRWKIPEMIMRMPTRTAITLSEPDG